LILRRDLSSGKWIKLKGLLFLLLGVSVCVFLVLTHPSLEFGLLLTIAIWCFCRFYYFAFYVMEHYVDQSYRFSGLFSLARHISCYGKQNARKPEYVPLSEDKQVGLSDSPIVNTSENESSM
jgi:hypothetical protein